MSPVLIERLVEIAQAARAAGYGDREPIYQCAMLELGLSRATLLRKLKTVAFTEARKRRSDHGETCLTPADGKMLAAYMRVHTRATGKPLVKLEHAVDTLRTNGEIVAARLDTKTGELVPLSITAIRRALSVYRLDSATLNAPAPHVELSVKHPNHVWEIDASICVLYYLPTGGLAVMDAAVFEKNKPGNFKKVEKDRVWRYAVVDKCTGAIYVEYVFGGESGANVSQIFTNAIQQRAPYPFYGVPHMIYVDPGCANTGAIFKNLARGLQIDLRWHLPGNARATGAVEKAHDIIECQFEGRLASMDIQSIEQLNFEATRWMHMFNASRIHSRHQMTRYGAWVKIKQHELRLAPALDVCRELARSAPERRVVTGTLSVNYGGAEYDVSGVPDICNGQAVLVCRNPWRPDAVQIVQAGEDGHDKFYVAEAVGRTEWGYRTDAVPFGEKFSRHADTHAQKSIKLLDRLITGETSDEAVAKAKKAKKLPFDGRIDAFKTVADFTVPAYLPRAGTAMNIPNPAQVVIKPLTQMQAAVHMRTMLGRAVTVEENQRIAQLYPDGVPEEALQELAATLRQAQDGRGAEEIPSAARLRMV